MVQGCISLCGFSFWTCLKFWGHFHFQGPGCDFPPQTHKLYLQDIFKVQRNFKAYELDFESTGWPWETVNYKLLFARARKHSQPFFFFVGLSQWRGVPGIFQPHNYQNQKQHHNLAVFVEHVRCIIRDKYLSRAEQF